MSTFSLTKAAPICVACWQVAPTLKCVQHYTWVGVCACALFINKTWPSSPDSRIGIRSRLFASALLGSNRTTLRKSFSATAVRPARLCRLARLIKLSMLNMLNMLNMLEMLTMLRVLEMLEFLYIEMLICWKCWELPKPLELLQC